MAEKLRKMFSFVGLRDEVFPGIRLAFVSVLALATQFRQQLLDSLALSGASREVSYTVVAVMSVVGSIALWAWAGYVLDPIYDRLYGPRGAWTSPGRKWLFFSSGYDLDQFRSEARKALAKEDASLWGDPSKNIYKPILDRLKQGDAARYDVVAAELENSKAFRSAVLPLLALAIAFVLRRSWSPALVATLAFMSVLELSFRYRANHCLEMYRWFVNRSA